jgi:hypothetical protein
MASRDLIVTRWDCYGEEIALQNVPESQTTNKAVYEKALKELKEK